MKRFKIKTEVCFSENAIDALTEIKGKNAVIFTDSFMASSGAADRIAEKLGNCSSISVFDKVKPDPPIELVTEKCQCRCSDSSGWRFLHRCSKIGSVDGEESESGKPDKADCNSDDKRHRL